MLSLRDILQENNQYVIYGAGMRGKKIAYIMQKLDIICLAFVDQDVHKHGTEIFGITVYGKDYLCQLPENVSIIVSIDNGEAVYKELSKKFLCAPYKTCEMILRLSYFCCEEYGFKSVECIDSYTSPYPDKAAFTTIIPITDIDFNMPVQSQWYNIIVDKYKNLKNDIMPSDVIPRYYESNGMYGVIDALVLHSFMTELRPQRIMEIGSGFSSAVMLDTNEYCMDSQICLEFVEPCPARLNALLKPSDKINLHEKPLQDTNIKPWGKLEKGDILFIDSSHMSKRNSDVNTLYFQIIPMLNSGVYIHIHDIFADFEYPTEWIQNGQIWNESYILRAFLMNNKDYEIVFFCDMWNEKFKATGLFDNFVNGSNLWLRKK